MLLGGGSQSPASICHSEVYNAAEKTSWRNKGDYFLKFKLTLLVSFTLPCKTSVPECFHCGERILKVQHGSVKNTCAWARLDRKVLKRESSDHLAQVNLPLRVMITEEGVCVRVCVCPTVKGDDHSCVFDLKTAGGLSPSLILFLLCVPPCFPPSGHIHYVPLPLLCLPYSGD